MKRRISKEKVFVFLNIVIIVGIAIFYISRAIYYYKKTNYIPKSDNLYSMIVNLKNISANGEDGLYNSNNIYYFKGKEVKNYLVYSNMLWRIVEIDDTSVKLILDDSLTSLVYGVETNYSNSYIFNWLNNEILIGGLSNLRENGLEGSWCSEDVDVNNYSCKKNINAYVGLLSTEEYIRAGGKNSYLNNNSYWWTLNTSKDGKVYYIEREGKIEDESNTPTTYYSYGVRPVILLDSNISYISGDGSQENPYIVEENLDIEINNHPIGTYISYNGYTFRIMEKTNEYTKIILDGYLLDLNGEPLKLSYNNLNSYLEKNFLSNFNKENLLSIDYYYGNYDSSNNYNYDLTNQQTYNSYVGIPVIGDMYIVDYPLVWLNNSLTSDEKLIFTSTNVGSIFADFSTSENYVRPIICIRKGLIVSGGEGTKNNPLVIGDNNEVKN